MPLASDESAEGRRGDARTAGGSSRERSLVAEFHEWATDAGVELAPCFEMRRCYAERSVEKRTELVLPVLCLAVYEGERLVELAPHATAEGVVTVTDSLERLENDERDGRERESMVPPAD